MFTAPSHITIDGKEILITVTRARQAIDAGLPGSWPAFTLAAARWAIANPYETPAVKERARALLAASVEG